jgi:hypothetical protein
LTLEMIRQLGPSSFLLHIERLCVLDTDCEIDYFATRLRCGNSTYLDENEF